MPRGLQREPHKKDAARHVRRRRRPRRANLTRDPTTQGQRVASRSWRFGTPVAHAVGGGDVGV